MDLVVHSVRARELAEMLAERTGQSISVVVERVLEEKLAATQPALSEASRLTPEEKIRRVNELLARSGPEPPGATSDHSDPYDEDGLPA